MKQNLFKRTLCFLLTAAMLLALVVLPAAPQVSAASALLTLDEQEPEGFDDLFNPYGYDEGVAFQLLTRNELLFYGASNGSNNRTIDNSSNYDDFKSFVTDPKNTGKAEITDYAMWSGTYAFMEADAFDMDYNSGNEEYVAFVGVKDGYLWAWVTDIKGKKASSNRISLGSMSWVDNSYNQYSSTSLVDVVAGDFDGDGRDSIVVYSTRASSDGGCTLYELKYNTSSNSLSQVACSDVMLNSTYTDNKPADTDNNHNNSRNKLGASMEVGDFNGDGIDDLAVLSYTHNITNYQAPIGMHDTTLKICYGKDDLGSVISGKADYTTGLQYNDGKRIYFPIACCLAAGDYNNDGIEDLYVTGVRADAPYSGANLQYGIAVSGSDWWFQCLLGGTAAMAKGGVNTVGFNGWFDGGFYTGDNCYGEVTSVGVAINGPTSPDMLFVCGDLYDVSSGAPIRVARDSYFNEKDDGLRSNFCTNVHMQSAVAGNFDGNDAGREQVAFTIFMKQSGEDDYYIKSGFYSGKDFNDLKDNNGEIVSYGPATGYEYQRSGYLYENDGDNLNEGLGCFFVPVDYDDDSLTARYLGANYVYTDPVVRAVLQAAPYFGDISTAGVNSTGYSLTTTYQNDEYESDSGSFSGGFAIAAGAGPLFSVNYELGLQGSVTHTFTDTYHTTYTETVYASTEDVVVVERVPLAIHQFDVADTHGNWNGAVDMEYTVPMQPVTESLSVDAYNSFVADYNGKMTASCKGDWNPLTAIDKAANWLEDNEGNPWAYKHTGWSDESCNMKQISKKAYSLGTANGVTNILWDEGNSHTDDLGGTFGFHISYSNTFGPAGMGAGLGFALAGQYDHGWGSATTNGTATGSICQIQDLDRSGLRARGVSDDVIDQYHFSWTYGRWERQLGNVDEDGNPVATPFIGYDLTDVSSPPLRVEDLSVDNVTTDSVTLTWTTPDAYTGWPAIHGYQVYELNTDNLGKQEMKLLGTTTETTYTVGDLEPLTRHTYVVTSYHIWSGDRYESHYSDPVTCATLQQTYTFNYEFDDTAATVDVLNGVASGSAVVKNMVVGLSAAPSDPDDYEILGLEVYIGTDDTPLTIPVKSDGTARYYGRITDDVTVKVLTKERPDEMTVNYTKEVSFNGQIHGRVSASLPNATVNPGDTVQEAVTFTGEAEYGYRLAGWKLTANGITTITPADPENGPTYRVDVIDGQIDVRGIFQLETVENHLVTVEQPEHGMIALYQETERLLPNGVGKYVVADGTQITVEARPEQYYALEKWTADAAGQTGDSFTITVTEDLTIGAVISAPVLHQVQFSADNGGFIAVVPDTDSGTAVLPDTTLTFLTSAAAGKRLDSWTVTEDGESRTLDRSDTCCLSDALTLPIKADTTVKANYVDSTQQVTVNLEGQGSYQLLSGGKLIRDGKVGYLEDVTIRVKPASGWQFDAADGWYTSINGAYWRQYKAVDQDLTIALNFSEIPPPEPIDPGHPDDCVCTKYVDVDETDWFHDAVVYAIDNGMMQGTAIGIFKPNMQLTRAMLVRTIYNNEGTPAPTKAASYTDVSPNAWYSDAIAWATENNIVNGVGNNKFAPDAPLTREQMVTMIYRYIEYLGYTPDGFDALSAFTDSRAVSDYALRPMQWAVGKGIVNGVKTDVLAPQGTSTRAQAATVMMRTVQGLKR